MMSLPCRLAVVAVTWHKETQTVMVWSTNSKRIEQMIIRKLRLDKGYSQEQLAEMAGISTRTLQRIERGANASPETLKCLAAVLEVDFTDLREEQTMSTDTRLNPSIETTPSTTRTVPIQPVADRPSAATPTAASSNATKASELSADEREAMEYVRDIRSFLCACGIQYGVVMTILLGHQSGDEPGLSFGSNGQHWGGV